MSLLNAFFDAPDTRANSPLRLSDALDADEDTEAECAAPVLPAASAKKAAEPPLTARERHWRDEALYWKTRAEAREVVAAMLDYNSLMLALEFYASPDSYDGGEESGIAKDGGNRARMVLEAVKTTIRQAKDKQAV